MSWRVRALVGDKKRTCKVVNSTSVREPVCCFELLIDVDKTPAQSVSGKLVGDKKRTCKVVNSTSVREPVCCFELLIDVDKTPAQSVSGKQHLRFLHEIARSSGCCCTYNISCLGIPKFVWARHDTNQTLYLCSRKPSYKSLIVERLQLTAIFVWGSCIIWPLPYGSSVMPVACLWKTEEERRVV